MNRRSGIARARTALGLGLGGLCLWLAFRSVPLREVGQVLTSARLAPLALAVAAIVGATLVRAWRWQMLFPASDRDVRFMNLWPIIVVGQMVNILVPARAGDVVRLYAVERMEKRAPGETLGTIAVEKALDAAVFLVLLWTLSLSVAVPGMVNEAGVILSVLLGAGVGLLWLSVLFGDRAVAWIARTPVLPSRPRQLLVERWLQPLIEGFTSRRRFGALLYALALSFLVWGAAWLANYFCLDALGIEPAATAGLAVLLVVQLGTAVPVSPGGLGVFEYLCVLALALFAVPRATAVSFAVLLHAVAYLPPAALGAVFVAVRATPRPWGGPARPWGGPGRSWGGPGL